MSLEVAAAGESGVTDLRIDDVFIGFEPLVKRTGYVRRDPPLRIDLRRDASRSIEQSDVNADVLRDELGVDGRLDGSLESVVRLW